jgi:hypothetical protein
MDSFNNEDINLFIKSYELNLLDNVMLNEKLPVWVEYLKAKRHYQNNGMDEDYFFKKRFNITYDDLASIHKLMDRVKQGKKLTKDNASNNVRGSSADTYASGGRGAPSGDRSSYKIYSDFNENEEIDDKAASKFELLSQVEGAMAEYYSKMKKQKDKKLAWKNGNKNYRYQRELQLAGSVGGVPDQYYLDEQSQARPQIEYDVQDFAKSPLFNMSKTNIINRIDKVSDILAHNNLISNDFDTEYKKSVPVINTRKQTWSNEFDIDNIAKMLGDESHRDVNYVNTQSNNKISDPVAQRFWQDQDIMNSGSTTRKPAIKNEQPFENQFQYLDCNYNRVMDDRLLGQSSRMDNREYKR